MTGRSVVRTVIARTPLPAWRTALAALGLGTAGVLLVISPFDLPCVFAALGWDGPMCGGTRMLAALLRGHPVRAVEYNAFAALVLLPSAVALLVAGARYETGRAWRLWPSGAAGTVAAALMGGGLLLWTVLRNLPVEPFTTLAV
ncbi:DUF2752 domain-containing protein [Actinopolyspora mortivallis]|uniref:DUF2752 domain-containing protein n=1 Tax=Actinopolyspora mortivallis TaxID=33906 RepID=UPI002158DDA8|nr:DUF2752 domain-containing protein [Actinopolyspora mortivallis]